MKVEELQVGKRYVGRVGKVRRLVSFNGEDVLYKPEDEVIQKLKFCKKEWFARWARRVIEQPK